MQRQINHYNIIVEQVLKFHLKETPSLPITFLVEGSISVIRMMPPKESTEKGGPKKTGKEAQSRYNEKGNNLTAK